MTSKEKGFRVATDLRAHATSKDKASGAGTRSGGHTPAQHVSCKPQEWVSQRGPIAVAEISMQPPFSSSYVLWPGARVCTDFSMEKEDASM